jgi:hypothetical protein
MQPLLDSEAVGSKLDRSERSAPIDARKNDMVARHAVAVVTLLSFSPALAENLDAEAARRFIVGKLFAFTCADGSRGIMGSWRVPAE